jgi:hypothetical protein
MPCQTDIGSPSVGFSERIEVVSASHENRDFQNLSTCKANLLGIELRYHTALSLGGQRNRTDEEVDLSDSLFET